MEEEETKLDASMVTIVSKHTVQPKQNQNPTKLIHLTPFDLKMLYVQYIQKGLLFHKPQNQSTTSIISNLLSSFSLTLDRFYPFAGRLLTSRPDNENIFISIHCNNKGAEFIHAHAPHIKVSDIIIPSNDYYIPPVVHSFFPLNGLFNHEGHEEPLLGVQVTELLDGIFIGCSLNHVAGDGNTFWQFFNTWSRICRNSCNVEMSEAPLQFDRWFPNTIPPPIHIPIKKYPEFKKPNTSYRPECFFRFSSGTVKRLKEKANEEMDTSNISSLQALVAHVWKSVTRARITSAHARAQEVDEDSFCWFLVSFRTKANPQLPDTYVGNSVIPSWASVSTWDIQSKCVGFTASILNQVMNSKNEASIYEAFESWNKDPTFVLGLEGRKDWKVGLSSSPRFDVYGNDFGWGKPVGVRSGPANKGEGKTTLFPGVDGGIDMEIALSKNVMETLLLDKYFTKYIL